MTVRGTAEEIREAVKGLVPAWPIRLIDSLGPGEWHFILNGVDTKVEIISDDLTT